MKWAPLGIIIVVSVSLLLLYDSYLLLTRQNSSAAASSSSSSSSNQMLHSSSSSSAVVAGGGKISNSRNKLKVQDDVNEPQHRRALQVKALNAIRAVHHIDHLVDHQQHDSSALSSLSTIPFQQADETADHFLLRRSRQRKHQQKGTTPIRNEEEESRIFLVPVNSGYLDFGLNLLCSLEALSSSSSSSSSSFSSSVSLLDTFSFVAMDATVDAALRDMHLPVFRDPAMPFVSSKSAAWADPQFHRLVCTKLFPVVRALKLNLSVVLSDADIVFRRDPSPYLQRPDLDMIFSIGSCHRDLPDNFDLLHAGDGLAKLNTGFYSATPKRAALLELFEKALKRCKDVHQLENNEDSNDSGDGKTKNENEKSGKRRMKRKKNTHRGTGGGAEALEGDQPAMNAVLNENIQMTRQRRHQQQQQNGRKHSDDNNNDNNADKKAVHFGFFDGCLFANGCVFFKHLCANASSLDPASPEAIKLLRDGKKMPHRKIVAGGAADDLGGENWVRRDDPILVHANFLVGKADKIKHLKKAGLWFEQCIAQKKLKKKSVEW